MKKEERYCVFSRAKNGRITHEHFKILDTALILVKELDKKKRGFTLNTYCNWEGRMKE